jgi:phage shock protein A
MSFFKRLFRIGQANANAALDKLEDPVKMIEQILRELENDIAKVTAAVTTQMAVEKRFERELNEAIETVEKRDEQARAAIAKGEDELARQALLDKKRHSDKRDHLQVSYDNAKATSEKLRKQLQDMKNKVDEMKTQKSTLIAQAQAAQATKKITQTMSGVGSNNLVDSFKKMEEKIQQMHDEAEAAHQLADEGKSIDDKFNEMMKSSSATEVDDELAALKAELNKE